MIETGVKLKALLLAFFLLLAPTLAAQIATAPGDICAGGNIAVGGQQAVNNALYQCTTTGVTQKWYPQSLYLGGTAATCDADHAGLMRYGSNVGAAGGISFVQKTSTIEGPYSGASSASFATLPNAGDTIIVTFGGYLNGGVSSVSDNQGNVYNLVLQNQDIWIYAAYRIGAPSGAFTITVTPVGSGNYWIWGALDYAGISAVDQTGIATSSTTTNTVTTTGATTRTNELVVAAIKLDGNGTSWTTNVTHDPSYTEQFLQNAMTPTTVAFSAVTKLQAVTGTPSHQWTYTANPGGAYTTYAAMATFKSGFTPEICDGTSWRRLFQSSSGVTAPAGSGYFVLTDTAWSGNLGGLAGANSKCFTELTSTYTSWRGYSAANSNSQLTTDKIKAFLCDQDYCQKLIPLTTYSFAYANSATAGGATFTTGSTGDGPNDYNPWSAANFFSGTYDYWTNMASTSDLLWANTPAGNLYGTYQHCANWTDGTSGQTGAVASSAQSDARRWWAYTYGCNTPRRLICAVNP